MSFGKQLSHFLVKPTPTLAWSNDTSIYLPKRNKNVCPHKTPIWIFIWAKKGKSVHKQMNGLKELWHIQSMECCSGTKWHELPTQATTRTNLHRYYVEQRKSDMNEHTLYDSVYTRSRRGNTNLWRQKIRMMAASTLGETEKGQEEILWVIKTFCILWAVWVSQVYTFVKTHLIVYIKSMHLVDGELNLT